MKAAISSRPACSACLLLGRGLNGSDSGFLGFILSAHRQHSLQRLALLSCQSGSVRYMRCKLWRSLRDSRDTLAAARKFLTGGLAFYARHRLKANTLKPQFTSLSSTRRHAGGG